MNEIWLPVVNYEGRYEVSNMGRIKSLLNDIIMKYHTNNFGYCTLSLCKDGAARMWQVHRVVAIAFIPNPENKPEVNHKFGIKSDNRASELEWATKSENIRDAFKKKLVRRQKGKNHHLYGKLGYDSNRKFTVLQIDKTGNLVAEYGSGLEASRRTGINKDGIYKCCNGKQKKSGKFLWQYKTTKKQ